MSKLNIDQKCIKDLFSDKKVDFLIPDYQRPYAWEDKECQTLWDDLFTFAFPDNDCDKFDSSSDEYFLGPVVTFKNAASQHEIIDGQQRLTTLMLLLRAFYDKYGNMNSDKAIKTSKLIEQCIWKTDEFGEPDKTALKINSEVASDNDKDEFLNILRTGIADDAMKSRYALNYRFFQKKIIDFLNNYPDYFSYLPIRILNNCILLPIEAESQDTALRIFSTLNDRGKPLSDADIFKAQFYKYYSLKGEKDSFIKRWKELESLCEKIFHPITGTPMDELFTRYMYYERSKKKLKSSTVEALRKFYEKDGYSLLKNEDTFDNMINLANFWLDVDNQNKEIFSDRVLKRLYVLNYAPNGMWTYILSVYYMTYKDNDGKLDDEKLYNFLNKIIAFIWAYAVVHPGVNALRTPVFAEMVNIYENIPVTFEGYKFNRENLRTLLDNYVFNNNRTITKSILTWWAFNNESQELLSLDTRYEIEHIFAKNRQKMENSLNNPDNIEKLGNKVLLEKNINIRVSDYKFDDKIKYYKGYVNSKGKEIKGSDIAELASISINYSDFTEDDIMQRNEKIINGFLNFVVENDLMQ